MCYLVKIEGQGTFFFKTSSQMVTNDNVSTLTADDEQYGALLNSE